MLGKDVDDRWHGAKGRTGGGKGEPSALPDRCWGRGVVAVRFAKGRQGAIVRDPPASHLQSWRGHTIQGGERQHHSERVRRIHGGRRWICGGEAWGGRGGAHPCEVMVGDVVQEQRCEGN